MGSLLARFVFLFAVLLIANPALATHEVDHRYFIFGHVSDPEGKPLSGQKVTAIDTTIQLQESGYTDSNGSYEILLHLHDANKGDALEVWAGDQKKEGTVTFDSSDMKTPRRHQVDFGAPAAEKGSALLYGVLGLAVAGTVTLWVVARNKKRKPKADRKRAQSGPRK